MKSSAQLSSVPSAPSSVSSAAPTSLDPSEEESREDFVSSLGVMDPEGQKAVFEIIPSKPDGNCMYRALSQAMYGSERHHEKCRQEVVEYISDDLNWPHFSTHIKGQNDHLVHKRKKDKEKEAGKGDKPNGATPSATCEEEEEDEVGFRESYRKYMLGDGIYGTLQELIAASDVFQFNLIVVRQLSPAYFNILSFKDNFNYDITHHFLFTGSSPDDGHFEYLEPTSQFLEIQPNSFKLVTGYYKIISIEEHCVVMQQHFGPVPTFDDTEEEGHDTDGSATQRTSRKLDINANMITHDSPPPSGRIPARIELKRTSSRVNTDSDGSCYRVGRRPSMLSQCFRNKVHPSSSDGSCQQLIPRLQQRKGSGGRVKEGHKWKRCLQSFFCCSSGGQNAPSTAS